MKPYIVSLCTGVLVGVVYGLLNVRSPAPPVIALIGLLGMLVGEQIVPIAKRLVERQSITVSAIREDCGNHVFGRLPGRVGGSAMHASADQSTEPHA
jgi:XapX domain-containing protein